MPVCRNKETRPLNVIVFRYSNNWQYSVMKHVYAGIV